ncbi:hypothetical protein SEPCBS57363_002927 [Sporothrix epigloea]|uniref:Uncharacterized protein n=1 Tax=Sporothrix epigloea TaxID=1892477 RepID=A0ABP0DM10_9PEZI
MPDSRVLKSPDDDPQWLDAAGELYDYASPMSQMTKEEACLGPELVAPGNVTSSMTDSPTHATRLQTTTPLTPGGTTGDTSTVAVPDATVTEVNKHYREARKEWTKCKDRFHDECQRLTEWVTRSEDDNAHALIQDICVIRDKV